VTEEEIRTLVHGMVKHAQFYKSFMLCGENGSFQTLQSYLLSN